MVATEFAVNAGHRPYSSNDLVRPWIPRLPFRTRGCERRLRFIERRVADVLDWGSEALRAARSASGTAQGRPVGARTRGRRERTEGRHLGFLAPVAGVDGPNAHPKSVCVMEDDSFSGVLGTVGHELRGPLGVTLSWLELLLADERRFDEKALRGLRAIERSARLQHRLIEDMLDVARIGTAKLQLELAPVDLSHQCGLVVAAFEPKARALGIVFEADVVPGVVLPADAARVQQVLQNLLDNALKFTPSGGHVRLSLRVAAGRAELVVADDGRGIDAELLPRIFDPYRQGEPGGRRSAGLGLGLAIAKRISELHQGELLVASEGAGRGATFTWRLRLPAKGRA
jgi:signal transduction histidine kinase